MQPNSHKFIIRRAGLNIIYFHDKEAVISDYKKALLLDSQNLFSQNQAITTGTLYSQNVVDFGKSNVDEIAKMI